ncbi:MAG TPA: hypothetical protein VLC08_15565 [Chitinolyticbacter sp.]|nr:hypothetical protein [Chitinolyticbacter sp.]
MDGLTQMGLLALGQLPALAVLLVALVLLIMQKHRPAGRGFAWAGLACYLLATVLKPVFAVLLIRSDVMAGMEMQQRLLYSGIASGIEGLLALAGLALLLTAYFLASRKR